MWRQILGTVPPDDRPKIFANAAAEVAGYVAKGLDRAVAADELTDMAAAYGLEDTDAVQATIADAFKKIDTNGNGWTERDFSAPPQSDEQRPLPWLDMSSWDDGEPPTIDWSITNLVPREQAGLFSGVGGTGKTTTELLKDVAHVIGLPWLNWMPTQGPVIFVGCEDTDKVWRIRLTEIAKHFNTTFADLIKCGFHLLNLFGQDATMFHHSGKSSRVETTPLYQQLYQAAGDLKPVNISLDPLGRIFAGNEMDRTQVYGLVGHVQALALASGGSVTLLTHPSLQGIRSGSGYSGSTAWHDAFRFRQYLRAAKDDDSEPIDPANDNGLRELTFMKNQYGPPAAKLTLRWHHGLFLPESSGAANLEKLAEDAKADTAFLDLLDRFTAQGRNVSHAPQQPQFRADGVRQRTLRLQSPAARGRHAPPVRAACPNQGPELRQGIKSASTARPGGWVMHVQLLVQLASNLGPAGPTHRSYSLTLLIGVSKPDGRGSRTRNEDQATASRSMATCIVRYKTQERPHVEDSNQARL